MDSIVIQIASLHHVGYAHDISALIEESAKKRGTGIAKRSPSYIIQKINERKAIIAVTRQGELVGFCYIESWGNTKYVANSGLVIHHKFRNQGVAKKIKKLAFHHSIKMFPEAKLFGLTTSLPVMKINSELGYEPVTFSELTDDDAFWKGCQSCVNYEILQTKNRSNCLCTGMLYNPAVNKGKKKHFWNSSKWLSRWATIKNKMGDNKLSI